MEKMCLSIEVLNVPGEITAGREHYYVIILDIYNVI